MQKYDRIIRSLCMIRSWMPSNIDTCTSVATKTFTTSLLGYSHRLVKHPSYPATYRTMTLDTSA